MLEVLYGAVEGAVEVLFFTADALLWAVVSLISLVFSATRLFLDLAVTVTVAVVPALGSVVKGLLLGGLQVLELLLNVLVTVCSFTVNIIVSAVHSAMLYLALLLTTLAQLCVNLFHTIAGLDWALILEHIRSILMLVANTIIDCLALVFNATMYVLGVLYTVVFQLLVLISSVLWYTWSVLVMVIERGFQEIQSVYYGDRIIGKEILLFGVLGIFSVFVVYNLAIRCLQRCLRWKARKRRQRMLRNEASARRRRHVMEPNEHLPPEPPRDNTAIRRRNYREAEERHLSPPEGRRRNPEVNQFGIDRNQQYLEYLDGLLNNYSAVKNEQSPRRNTKSKTSPQVVDEGKKSEEEGSISRLQELERELMREKEAKQCVVCMDRPREMMTRPCNHYCVCEQCSKQLSRCPICTKRYTRMEKVFNV